MIALVEAVARDVLAWREDASARQVHSREDYKTEADRRAHERLVEGLDDLFAGVPIWSEENAPHPGTRPDAYWLIDPIDGTASWYEGFAGFAVQAAWIEGETPVAGVAAAPALGKTWSARRGGGAHLNGVALPPRGSGERLLIVDNYPDPRRAARLLMDALPGATYTESGSLGCKLCMVADGSADLFVKDVVIRDWDVAPAAVLLAEVGATLVMPDGTPYRIGGPMEKPAGVVAARDAALANRAVAALGKGA